MGLWDAIGAVRPSAQTLRLRLHFAGKAWCCTWAAAAGAEVASVEADSAPRKYAADRQEGATAAQHMAYSNILLHAGGQQSAEQPSAKEEPADRRPVLDKAQPQAERQSQWAPAVMSAFLEARQPASAHAMATPQ